MTALSVNPDEHTLTPAFQEAVRIYAQGDRIERYNHGQILAPSDKSYSLLFFPADNLIFPPTLITKIHHFFTRNNLVYIGDIVTQSLQNATQDCSGGQGLGAKSQNALCMEIARIGLNFNLRVAGGWPPECPELMRKEICSQAGLYYSRGNKLQKYLSRLTPDAS